MWAANANASARDKATLEALAIASQQAREEAARARAADSADAAAVEFKSHRETELGRGVDRGYLLAPRESLIASLPGGKPARPPRMPPPPGLGHVLEDNPPGQSTPALVWPRRYAESRGRAHTREASRSRAASVERRASFQRSLAAEQRLFAAPGRAAKGGGAQGRAASRAITQTQRRPDTAPSALKDRNGVFVIGMGLVLVSPIATKSKGPR